jgi:3-oxoadipate enol-lactonase
MFHAVGDRRVHSVSFGGGPGTLVGVAGSFASWEIWAPTFELLSDRWRVVSFDHDGVGQTKVPVEEITHERHLETLFSVLDAQRVDRCVIAGDSNNATLALEAALEQPDRFAGVVIVNGHAWDFDTPEAHRFVDGLRSHYEATREFFVKIVFPEPDSEHLQRWLADIIDRTGPEAAARITEMYYGLDLRPRLGALSVPAMIVHGALDVLSPSAMADAEELATLVRAELHVLPDVGHLPLLSQPEQVAVLLDAFLGEHCSK